MSKEAVINLFKASAEDQTLQAQLEAADSPATVVQLGTDKGYEFNEAEYAEVVQEMMSQDEGALEDSELEVVAGGSDEGASARQKRLVDRYGYSG